MSEYENYDEVSQTYDHARWCDGVEMMTDVLVGILRKNVGDIHMLEAGCGTGNYSYGFLQNGIGKLTMLDASSEMLVKAKTKVQGFGSRVAEIRQHCLPSLPYADDSFDVVTLIQVLHHLDSDHLVPSESGNNGERVSNGKTGGGESNGESAYPNIELTCRQAYRVLKPGGVLLVNTCFHDNLEASYFSLTPKALSLMKELCISKKCLLAILRKMKFVNTFVVQDPESRGVRADVADNVEGILDAAWRKFDSGWSIVEKTGELENVIELIKRKKAENQLTEWTQELHRLRRVVGYLTTVFCQKPKMDPGK